MSTILVVDDEEHVLSSIQKILAHLGHRVLTARTGWEAVDRTRDGSPDLILLDVRMAGLDGLETLARVKSQSPSVPVLMMTAYATTETAIEALKAGAFDYVQKPFRVEQLTTLINKALWAAKQMREAEAPRSPPGSDVESILIGRSAGILEVCKRIGQIAGSSSTVLLRGEGGAGKEIVARTIHRHSPRSAKPFVVVRCSAATEARFGDALSDGVKGASGGTLFLDEIGELGPSAQARILGVLPGESLGPAGAAESTEAGIRILAATHLDLEGLVTAGRFRQDLFYWLSVVTIAIPPLRERKEDIPDLAEHFLSRFCAQARREVVMLSEGARERLLAHAWPGNVRELEHCLEQAALLCQGGLIVPEDVRLGPETAPPGTSGAGALREDAEAVRRLARMHLEGAPGAAHARLIEQVEREIVAEALAHNAGNVMRTARQLGISRPTLREKILKYGLKRGPLPIEDEE